MVDDVDVVDAVVDWPCAASNALIIAADSPPDAVEPLLLELLLLELLLLLLDVELESLDDSRSAGLNSLLDPLTPVVVFDFDDVDSASSIDDKALRAGSAASMVSLQNRRLSVAAGRGRNSSPAT
ncbi:hypothetical protein [Rhodopseudomonas sp.]|uniref:hypothetical protein n=1 Tax=Rhodopseudomonas sp. TaxID=1078 RepID=UPI0034550DE9